jgi:hypothetical protein
VITGVRPRRLRQIQLRRRSQTELLRVAQQITASDLKPVNAGFLCSISVFGLTMVNPSARTRPRPPAGLEHEVLSRHHFTTKAQARTVVVAWCQDFYNPQTPTQLGRIDAADPIRETRCRPTGRSVREAFTIRGKAQFMS